MVAAGIRMLAAQWAQDGTALTDDSAAAAATWEQWGIETLTFPDPGGPVIVMAMLSGTYDNSSVTSTISFARVAISVDGGATFTVGNNPSVSVGTTSGQRCSVCALASVSDTPTGDIVIKAEMYMNNTSTTAIAGRIQATVMPQ